MTLKPVKKTTIFIALVLLLLLLLVLLVSTPWLVNLDSVKQHITRRLFPHAEIRFSHIDLSLFPNPAATLENFSTVLPNGKKVTIQRARIYPDLSVLMNRGSVTVKKVALEGVVLEASATLPPIFPSPLFDFLPPSQEVFTLAVKGFSNDIVQNINGSFTVSPAEKKISGRITAKKTTIEIPGSPGSPLPDSINALFVNEFHSSFTYIDSGKLTFEATARAPAVTADNRKKLAGSKVFATLSMTREKMSSTLTLDTGETDLSVTFLRNGKTTSLTFQGKNIPVKKAQKTADGFFPDNGICRQIFKIISQGKVSTLSVVFSGDFPQNLFNPKNMRIHGTVDQAKVNIPGTPLFATNLAGDVRVENGTLYTDVFQGRIEHSIIKKGKLSVDLLEKSHDFNGRFFLLADLEFLPPVLKELLPDTPLARELDRCRDISGEAEAQLLLGSNQNRLSVSVNASSIALRGRYQRLPGEIVVTKGSFAFDGNRVSIDKVRGRIGGTRFQELSGSIRLDKNYPLTLQSNEIRADMAFLFPWLFSFSAVKKMMAPVEMVKGDLLFDTISVNGFLAKPDKLRYKIRGQCRDLSLGKAGKPFQLASLSCRFQASDKGADISRIRCDVAKTELLALFADIPFINTIAAPFSVARGVCRLGGHSSFQGDISFPDGPDLFISVTGGSDGLVLNKLSISKRRKEKKLVMVKTDSGEGRYGFSAEGEIDTRTLEKIVKKTSPLHETMKAVTGNRNHVITCSPDRGVVVSTDAMDLDRIMKIRASGKKLFSLDSRWFGENPFEFTLKSGRLTYGEMEFTPFSGRIKLTDNGFAVDDCLTTLCTVDLAGSMKNTRGSMAIQMGLGAENRDLARAIACFFDRQKLIQGHYFLSGSLAAKGDAKSIRRQFKGKVKFSSNNGRIYRLTLLSRILSVINLSKLFRGKLPDITQNGFGYSSMDIDARVEQNKIIIEKGVINGTDMTFILTGEYTIGTGKVDLVCLVAPFKSADMLVEKIPLLGSILNGRLVSFPLGISGTLQDPKVTMVSAQTIGEGVTSTMMRILKSPFNIMENLPL
ncbi:MAG: AsmA-like C-terminal domain-containing protein [Desulfobacteraceae bacterium]